MTDTATWTDPHGFDWTLAAFLSHWKEQAAEMETVEYYARLGASVPTFTPRDATYGRITDPVTGETLLERGH